MMTPLTAAALLALAGVPAQDVKQAPSAVDPAKAGIGRAYPQPVIATALEGVKVLVVAFSGPDCPLSRLYAPKLERLSKAYAPKGARILVVSSEDRAWTSIFGPERTTEAFVLDGRGVLRYRGAVDDQYGIGYQKAAPTATYLSDAIDALLAGRRPKTAATTAPGCAVAAGPAATPAVPTFHRDVAPILNRRCVECHRPGEIGPFSLLDYPTAKRQAAMIGEVVADRRMPPWHADPRHGTWKNDRRLTDAEIATITGWAKAGAPEGDPRDAPPAPAFEKGWRIGEPDLIVTMPKTISVPAEGTIPYKYAFARTRLEKDTWVKAVEVKAGAPEVVHHILVFVQYPLHRLKEQPKLDGGLFHGYFGIMVPGESPMVFGEGQGKYIPAGANLIFQIHYTATGTPAEDRSSIGLVFAKGKVTREVVTRGIVNRRIRIPAGAPNHEETADFTFDTDAEILSFLPHMHVRGKAFRYEAFYPDGRKETLLDVPAYDFNWQTCYRLAEPLKVPKGTRVHATAWYDNSKGNPANPDPSREVRFGEQTWDEMLIGYMDFVEE